MQLFTQHGLTAISPMGRYFGSDTGLSLVEGPPISVRQFSLAHDHPRWVMADPRTVTFSAWDLVHETARGLRRTRGSVGLVHSAAGRRCRDGRWLVGIIGRRLTRLVSRIPPSSSPYLLVWLTHRVPEFGQLVESAPMIAVLVTCLGAFSDPEAEPVQLVAAARRMARMPRRRLIESAGLPPGAIAGVSKITWAGADRWFLRQLGRSLQDATRLKFFNHSKCIGPDGLRLYAQPKLLGLVSGRFRRELAESDRCRRHAIHVPVLEMALKVRQCLGAGLGPRAFSSLRALDAWHNRICSRVSPEDLNCLPSARFPEAPVVLAQGVMRQIRTGTELLREAIEMENCCAQRHYTHRLANGQTYLFAVNVPDSGRLTMEIMQMQEENAEVPVLAVVQLAGKRNARPGGGAATELQAWALRQEIRWHVPCENAMAVMPHMAAHPRF